MAQWCLFCVYVHGICFGDEEKGLVAVKPGRISNEVVFAYLHVLQHSKAALGVQEYNYSCAVNVLNVPSEDTLPHPRTRNRRRYV